MKTSQSFPSALLVVAGFGLFSAFSVSAQTFDLVVVEKFSDFRQTAEATTEPWSNPFGFGVFAEGSGLSAADNGTFTSPGGSGTAGGAFVYEAEDDQLSFEVNFASQGELNTAFADGDYVVNVNGATLTLNLAGDLYPNTPLATFSQGFWSAGTFFFDPTQDLTITSNLFTAFDQNLDALMEIDVFAFTGPGFEANLQRFYSDDTMAPNALTLTIEADSLVGGQMLDAELGFISVVGGDADPLLPAALIAAVYSTFTSIQMQAIPEPASCASVLGGLGLFGAVFRRRRE